ncbi:helix-turn-helix domain-containing protein [Kocuria tytonis]|uniref:ArsR family transcriptional regulator n=1 Tax=Kocuria tytonis TaxID=2054280 RepID=A0A495A3R4_9MICC|nr:helix-turn-helix domain-containing protein [Kocuria tytonis]RKQ32920.1 ArsR family transcriptional regulator [Kocuria tytonis]
MADNANLTDFDTTVFLVMLGRLCSHNRIEPFTVTALAEGMQCSRSGLSRSLKRLREAGVIRCGESSTGASGRYWMNPEIAEYVDPETVAAMR